MRLLRSLLVVKAIMLFCVTGISAQQHLPGELVESGETREESYIVRSEDELLTESPTEANSSEVNQIDKSADGEREAVLPVSPKPDMPPATRKQVSGNGSLLHKFDARVKGWRLSKSLKQNEFRAPTMATDSDQQPSVFNQSLAASNPIKDLSDHVGNWRAEDGANDQEIGTRIHSTTRLSVDDITFDNMVGQPLQPSQQKPIELQTPVDVAGMKALSLDTKTGLSKVETSSSLADFRNKYPTTDEPEILKTASANANAHQNPNSSNLIDTMDPLPTTPVAEVVIHPPMMQPYKPNQYSFVLENQGRADAIDVVVGISVSDSATISAVLPDTAVMTPNSMQVRFEKIAAGERKQIHVTANSADEQAITFDATLTSKKVQNFTTSSTPEIASAYTNIEPTVEKQQDETKLVSRSPQMLAPSGSAPQQKFSAAVGPVQYQGGRVPNPFFDGTAPSQKLTEATNQPTPSPQQMGSIQHRPPIVSMHRLSNPLVTQETQAEAPMPTPQATPKPKRRYVVAAVITGPKEIAHDNTADYKISVFNKTGYDAEQATVQLAIPKGLQVLAAEPNAYFDAETNTVTWELDRITDNATTELRYRVRAIGRQLHNQKATLTIGTQVIGDTYFATKITSSKEESNDVAVHRTIDYRAGN